MSATPNPVEDAIRMTLPEIEAAYPDQWVVLGDIDGDDVTLEISTAVVRGRGKVRHEATASANAIVGEYLAVHFTGRPRNPRPW